MRGVRAALAAAVASGGLTAGVLVIAGPAGPAVGSTCNTSAPVTVTPDTALDNQFQAYGNGGTGTTWTGGDGTESVALPDGRELWLFDDSLLGKVVGGQRNFAKSPFLHNSLVVEQDGQLSTTYYTKPTRPATGYININKRRPFYYAFWPDAAVVDGNILQVLGDEQRFYRNGSHTGIAGNYLATLSLPSLQRIGITELGSDTGAAGSVGSTLSDGGYTYIYVEDNTGNVYAARVAGTDVASQWSFYDGSGWAPGISGAVAIEHLGMINHFSVSPVGGDYLFVARSTPQSNEIVGALGCSPVGPFGPTQDIYAAPEPSAYPAAYGVTTYGAHAHPELSTSPNTLVVSYDVNFASLHGLKNPDASVYRPRFIDVSVG